jgi:hypothetical protein
VLVPFDTLISGTVSEEVEEKLKNDTGRAMRTTPRREIRDAYCADRGKGSERNM